MSPEMTKNLSVVCAEVEKKYGKGAIMRLTDQPEIQPDDIISSGSIQLDVALGIGGYKKGRIVELYGSESSGKSTLCLHAVVQAQKQGKTCVYLDVEQSLD